MMKENVILADFDIPENWEFQKALENKTNLKWKAIGLKSNINHGSRMENFKRYFKYFYLPLTIFLHRNKYDVVLAWQQFFGLILAFYCRLFHVKKSPKIIVMTFIYKPKCSIVGKMYYRFMNYIVNSGYIVKFIVFSSSEPEYYSGIFGVPSNLFQVFELGIEDELKKYKDSEHCNDLYLVAAGRSNRDYDFLVDTFGNTEYNLKIICDEYCGEKYSNIEYYTHCYNEKYLKLLAGAYCVLVPLKDRNSSSGQLVILQAMMFGKPIIVTDSNAIKDYIKDGQNGFLIDKVKEKWLESVFILINDSETYVKMSCLARNMFINKYSLMSMGRNIGEVINCL